MTVYCCVFGGAGIPSPSVDFTDIREEAKGGRSAREARVASDRALASVSTCPSGVSTRRAGWPPHVSAQRLPERGGTLGLRRARPSPPLPRSVRQSSAGPCAPLLERHFKWGAPSGHMNHDHGDVVVAAAIVCEVDEPLGCGLER